MSFPCVLLKLFFFFCMFIAFTTVCLFKHSTYIIFICWVCLMFISSVLCCLMPICDLACQAASGTLRRCTVALPSVGPLCDSSSCYQLQSHCWCEARVLEQLTQIYLSCSCPQSYHLIQTNLALLQDAWIHKPHCHFVESFSNPSKPLLVLHGLQLNVWVQFTTTMSNILSTHRPLCSLDAQSVLYLPSMFLPLKRWTESYQ